LRLSDLVCSIWLEGTEDSVFVVLGILATVFDLFALLCSDATLKLLLSGLRLSDLVCSIWLERTEDSVFIVLGFLATVFDLFDLLCSDATLKLL